AEDVMSVVGDGSVRQVGTYNGNPLSMAAARANLLEVLRPRAYAHLEALNERIVSGSQGVIDQAGIPAYAIGIAAKGCITFSDARIIDYEGFMAHQDAALTALSWVYGFNRGIYMTPGRDEQWTLPVQHTEHAVHHR